MMTHTLEDTVKELAQRLELAEQRQQQDRIALHQARRRARVSGMVAALALGATFLLNIRPVAFAQTPGVSLASLVSEINSLTSRLSTDEGSISANASNISTNTTNITKQQTLTAPLSLSGTDFTFKGVNVHIVDGSGSNDDNGGTLSGLGNLIIGYNGNGTGGGSHNLVLGDRNTYTSYGGIVAGEFNTVSGPYASVTGGTGNQASGLDAFVTGGQDNTASGEGASISGGFGNKAAGFTASITGGYTNDAYGYISSITGGQSNMTGVRPNIGDSTHPSAPGSYASVSGGYQNVASGEYASVSGGDNITESTAYGWAGGSQGSTDYSGNFASP